MSRIEDGGAVEAGLEKLAGRAKSWSLGTNRVRVTVPLGEIRAALGEITRLRAKVEQLQRIERNRDAMWRGQCEGLAEQLRIMRTALSKASQAEGQTP